MDQKYNGIKYVPFYFSFYEVAKALDNDKRYLFEDAVYEYFFYDRPLDESTGDVVVDLLVKSISGFLESSKAKFVSGKKGGRPKNTLIEENHSETIVEDGYGMVSKNENHSFESEKPCSTMVIENENHSQEWLSHGFENEKPNNKNKNKNNNKNNNSSFAEFSLEPFYDEEKQKNYSGRLSKEEAEAIPLSDLYDMDRDILIDDKFSVNEYVDGFQHLKGYDFEYELPGNWNRNLRQLFKEAMNDEYGRNAHYK